MSSIDATGLFPFLDGYGVYAGTCRANNPAFWQSTYFQPGGAGHAALDPGDFLKPVDVDMGALRVVVRTATNTVFGATWPARVTVRLGDTGDTRTGCAANTLVYNIDRHRPRRLHPSDGHVPGLRERPQQLRSGPCATRDTPKPHPALPAPPRMAPTTALYQSLAMTLPSSGSSGACRT